MGEKSVLTNRSIKLTSLNSPMRKNELIRINNENQDLLERIRAQRPQYSKDRLDEEFRRKEKYSKNLSIFKETPRASIDKGNLNKSTIVTKLNIFYWIRIRRLA